MQADRVTYYYDELKSFYFKPDSDWTDKARSYRTIIHEFYNEITMSDIPFAEALKEFYRWNKQKEVEDFAFKIKDILNNIVHNNQQISEEYFLTIYESCVRLIHLSTGIMPDDRTLEILKLKKIENFEGLNQEQLEAVQCNSKVIYVNAGPGTGKTYLLVRKVLNYIISSEEKEKIVALSYTNTAANELGDKFYKIAFKSNLEKEYEFYNGTLHSFCIKMMRTFYATINQDFMYIIIDDSDIGELAKDISIELNNAFSEKDIKLCLESYLNTKNPKLIEIIKEIKQRYKIISIDDILTMFIDEISNNDAFKEWFKKQITVLVVDEAQDLSVQNYKIFEFIYQLVPNLKIFLVGDPRQNIYAWRGGSYEHLNEFLKGCEEHKTLVLTQTYRCPQHVCDYVNGFRFTDCENYPLKSNISVEEEISVNCYDTPEDEAEALVASLLENEQKWSNTAVLCLTMKYLAPFFRKLKHHKIPYKVFGGRRQVKEHIKTINHILKILVNENEYSIRRTSNRFRVDLEGIKKEYECKNKKEAFYKSPIGESINNLREEISRRDMSFQQIIIDVLDLIQQYSYQRKVADNSQEFADSPQDINDDYSKLKELSETFKTIDEYLIAFVFDKETFADFYEKDYKECEVPLGNHYLTVSTIHSAKGLEWDNVFIIGVSEEHMPNSYFVRYDSPDEQASYFNEIKKTMYVASTRTKKKLAISYTNSSLKI